MKKVIKLNSKGFALAEILVTTVFVMVIFSIIYVNYYPLMAEYEKREAYDDVDGKYAAYWFKRMIESKDYGGPLPTGSVVYSELQFAGASTENPDTGTIEYTNCDNPNWSSYKARCNELVKSYNVTKIYITKYTIDGFKNDGAISANENLKDYLNTLPNFTNKPSDVDYRVIVEMIRKYDDNSVSREEETGYSSSTNASYQNEYYAYSTIGVKK